MNAVVETTNIEATTNVEPARGYGVIFMNDDTTTFGYIEAVAGQPRVQGKGLWTADGAILNGPGFALTLKVVKGSKLSEAGQPRPRLRGSLTFHNSGEEVEVVAWFNPPKDDQDKPSYGISANSGDFKPKKAVAPF